MGNYSIAQTKGDSIFIAQNKLSKDSTGKKKVKVFSPRTATLRSTFFPGLGQIYNKKYWKLPLVYGALGTTAGIYFFNIKTYKALKLAYIYRTDTILANDLLIDPRFSNLSASAIRSYRNSYRQNIDYSVLFFILFWGLNIVDATVDAHLKAFDVNDNLSLQLKPGFSQMANTAGISLVLNIGKRNSAK
jgi:TM2 domain-containing membrane protein YozV